ncbi:hypothetical protein D9M71_733050 [compost metagenome]
MKPTRPLNAAGTRIEPPVSLPIAAVTMPLCTATAEPDDEPPGALGSTPGKSGVGVPKCGFKPKPENANSFMPVFPSAIIP